MKALLLSPSVLVALILSVMTLGSTPVYGESSQLSQVHVAASETEYSSTLWANESGTAAGLWEIVLDDEGGRYLVLGTDFKAKSGPELQILLSPKAPDKISRKNVLEGAYPIGNLQSDSGTQRFPISERIDLELYKSIVIYSAKKKRVWSLSVLSKGQVLYSSDTWKKKTKKTTGGYEIVQRETGMFIRFSEDFKTSKPPEPLRILLSPQTAEAAKNDTAERGALFLTELQNPKGGQEYKIEVEGDMSQYKSVLLNCKKYTKLWSSAELVNTND